MIEADEEGQEEEQAQEEEGDEEAAVVSPSATCAFRQAWHSCIRAQPARAALADSPGFADSVRSAGATECGSTLAMLRRKVRKRKRW